MVWRTEGGEALLGTERQVMERLGRNREIVVVGG